jgi:hypothetical protein
MKAAPERERGDSAVSSRHAATAGGPRPKLERELGLWMATALVIGNMVGSGISLSVLALARARVRPARTRLPEDRRAVRPRATADDDQAAARARVARHAALAVTNSPPLLRRARSERRARALSP